MSIAENYQEIRIENYLFVCRLNESRSPTAEEVCNDIVEKCESEIKVKAKASSAGFSPFSNRMLTERIADEADKIFVMEDYMKKILEEKYHQNPKKLISLNIPDIYVRNEPELKIILRRELYPYLLKNELLI